MKNIEHYCDYREYLKDFYAENKAKHPFFSYRYFCNKAGIHSSALYKEIVEGKRNLTEKTLAAFIKGLNLSEKDAHFFTALVHFNQAKTAQDKNRHLEEMRHLLPRLSEKLVPINFYAYYSKWYNIAIRELAVSFDWKGDYTKLANMLEPRIKPSEAKQAINLLLELGFLIKERDGHYRQSDPHITPGREVVSATIRNVNHQFAGLGMDAIHNLPPTVRDISSLTMGLTKENYQIIKQEIIAFKDRLKQIVHNQKSVDVVYNLNIQLFPVSREQMP